ncbi:hypothetical protein [Asticcacaulis excentricus]|uniref:Uncharacterized protein n=1 Tax=Asticcacaulis excentricus (strain ATCC 15261 / DSM 4724 / KCTC 12464 / NCIMB 9791 / VKM B-1370 / CB 48) TaxID=573065 RepID=E8RLR0_ASTEC|nr:hypothetical protein [Asticcacaulis excentricus]ADU12677.1 hypothetical protein Astex_0996 [Asticcacaulis excentricus CB 48]
MIHWVVICVATPGLCYCAFQLYRGLRDGEMNGLGFVPIFNQEPPLDRKADFRDVWITAAPRAATLLVGIPLLLKMLSIALVTL